LHSLGRFAPATPAGFARRYAGRAICSRLTVIAARACVPEARPRSGPASGPARTPGQCGGRIGRPAALGASGREPARPAGRPSLWGRPRFANPQSEIRHRQDLHPPRKSTLSAAAGFRTLVLTSGIRSASSRAMPTARLNLWQLRPPQIVNQSKRISDSSPHQRDPECVFSCYAHGQAQSTATSAASDCQPVEANSAGEVVELFWIRMVPAGLLRARDCVIGRRHCFGGSGEPQPRRTSGDHQHNAEPVAARPEHSILFLSSSWDNPDFGNVAGVRVQAPRRGT